MKMQNDNNVIKWLLENNNPAIKYRTLKEIIEHPDDDSMKELYSSIWQQTNIKRMFSKQDNNGLWNENKYWT